MLNSTLRLRTAQTKVCQVENGLLSDIGRNIQKEQASQVPTCLVITSSESASSIDTQFASMTKELQGSLKAIPIVLEDKKCGTMKATIEFIQVKLRTLFGFQLSEYTRVGATNSKSGVEEEKDD